MIKKNYLLRIEEEFWRLVKSKAASEGKTIREIILFLLEKWLKEK
jgi:hypothetical protein